MLGQAHIIHIGLLGLRVRQHYGIIPETEALGGAAAFSHGEEALAIHALHSNHQIIFAVQLDRAAVQRGVHAKTLHHVGIGLRVGVVHPEGRDVLPGQDGVLIAVEDSAANR